MEYFNKLKERHPDLVAEYAAMDKDALLNQICAEVLDLFEHEKRIGVFMELCSGGLSKTNYTEESIRAFVTKKQDEDIKDWCFDICKDATDEEILEEVKNQASLSNLV